MTVVPRRDLGQAVVGVNGVPPVSHPWWQVRTLGAASLDMSLVARGGLDGWCDLHGHGIWDYIAALLICREAGALVEDAEGRDLLTFDLTARRRPLVANSPEVMASLRTVAGRR